MKNLSIIYGTNSLDCLVKLEKVNNKIWFTDDTRGVCKQVNSNEELTNILLNNNFIHI